MTSQVADRPTGSRALPGYERFVLDLREGLEHGWRQHVDEVTELTIRLHDTRAALGQRPAGDTGLAADLDMIEAQLEVARRELAEHDDALARFAKGTYGFCGHCGVSITADRLAAFPSTRLCASCHFWSRRT